MPKSRRKPVARYHDRVAGKYDNIYDDPYWQWHDALTWDYLKPYLPKDHSAEIIDLGCGTGKWGIKLAQSGFAVTCLDISHKMVDAVQRKAESTGLSRVTAVQGDLADLSALPRDHFSFATAFGEPLCSTPSMVAALKQIRRILRPDGVLVATVDNRLNALDFFLDNDDTAGLELFLKNGRTHWLTRDRDEQFELYTVTPHQMARHLDSAGFELIETVGKTVLPMRRHRDKLEDRAVFRKYIRIEKKLARNADALGRAPHLQFAARVRES
jgi:SAM-dependent methyltransferase